VKVFVAGATGDLGRPVVRLLVEAGYEVWGMTRTPGKRGLLVDLGARPVVADALDPGAMERALAEARPEAVLHLLTALPRTGPLRARDLRATNELRQRGTANLVRAALAAGARRLVAESVIGVYGLASEEVVTEDSPLPHPDPHSGLGAAIAAMRSLEEQVLGADGLEGIVLRYGLVYGPDVGSTESAIERLRNGRLPVPGGGPGLGSWIHVEDAATATVAALERGEAGGVYNIVDDEPTSLGTLLATIAEAVGARPPRPVPVWLGRLLAPYATTLATRAHLRVSNERAKRELGWAPRFPTIREGMDQLSSRQ
jgi:2-alkyl-3-oxoalkanoate reductase